MRTFAPGRSWIRGNRANVEPGDDASHREVTSAHVSELTSPGDWLRGGELLMTVGLLLPMRLPDCRAYVSECATAGVAALALGLGHGLPYQECPEPLRRAARESGVPLLTVPDETPFIAVTKWVFETIARREPRELQTALEINRTLSAVATRSAPLAALLSAWSEVSATPCVVCDVAGRLVGATPATPPAVIDAAQERWPRRVPPGPAGRSSTASRCTRSARGFRWPTSPLARTWISGPEARRPYWSR